MPSMKILCRDPDDLVSFENNGIIERASIFKHEFITTDLIMNAYGEPRHQAFEFAKIGLVSIKSFSEIELKCISKIFERHQDKLSFACCSIIYYAKASQGVLISDQKIILNTCTDLDVSSMKKGDYYQHVQLLKTG